MILIISLAALCAFATAQDVTTAAPECKADLNALWENANVNGTVRREDVEETFYDLAALVSENGNGIPLADGVCSTGIGVATCLTDRDANELCRLTASADSESDPQVITITDIRALFNRADDTGDGVVYREGFIRAANEVCIKLPDLGQPEADC